MVAAADSLWQLLQSGGAPAVDAGYGLKPVPIAWHELQPLVEDLWVEPGLGNAWDTTVPWHMVLLKQPTFAGGVVGVVSLTPPAWQLPHAGALVESVVLCR